MARKANFKFVIQAMTWITNYQKFGNLMFPFFECTVFWSPLYFCFHLISWFLWQSKTVAEAKAKVSSQNVQSNICITFADILEALDILKGAVSIVYPMGLPEYDPIKMEMENREELAGTQAQVRGNSLSF